MNTYKYFGLMLILLFGISFSSNYCIAQRNGYSSFWDISGAKELKTMWIDTTDVNRLRALIDTPNTLISDPVLVYFAQHGDRSVLSKVNERYYEYLSKGFWVGAKYMLAARVALDGSLAFPLFHAALDTMLIQNREGRNHYSHGDLLDVITLLVDIGDYSQYDLFKQLVRESNNSSSYPVPLYFFFAKDPTKENDAYDALRDILLNDPNKSSRSHALHYIKFFNNRRTENLTLFRQVALNDSSAEIRYWAIYDLVNLKDYAYAIQSYKALVKMQIDTMRTIRELEKFMPKEFIKGQLETQYCEYAITDIKDINSPYAYKTLLELQTELQPGPILDKLLFTIETYRAPGPQWRDSLLTVSKMVDSLGSHLTQCASLSWLGNQSFVAQLSQYVNTAKGPLRTTADSIWCARNIMQFQQTLDQEYHDSLNITNNFVTLEGRKFLYYSAQHILDRLPVPSASLIVKLVNSNDADLIGGTLQYRDSTWKDATNNNDGTFTINTNNNTLSIRMTYEYGIQTKTRVFVGFDTVVFKTVNSQIRLQTSSGNPLDTGMVQYNAGGWRDFGTTSNGIVTKELLPIKYSFKMTYNNASIEKAQSIDSNATVVFQTISAKVQLQTSAGAPLDTGIVQYNSGGWKDFGITSNGVATKELLPIKYTFRLTYNDATISKAQNIDSNATVIFQTVPAKVQLQASTGAPLDTGIVEYNSGGWKSFGITSNGIVTKELLPTKYNFRITYNGATVTKSQSLDSNATVVFQTIRAKVQLQTSQGAPLDTGIVEYNSGGWKNFGTTLNGVVTKELLPTKYTFRITYDGATVSKAQSIDSNATVIFQTVKTLVQFNNSKGNPMPAPLGDTGIVQFNSGGWQNYGSTSNGIVTKELLPVKYTFRLTYNGSSVSIAQNVDSNVTVVFSTVLCTVSVTNAAGSLLNNATVSYNAGGWKVIGTTTNGIVTIELLPVKIQFRAAYGSKQQSVTQDVSTNPLIAITLPVQ
jgi:hypothetical protein